MKNPRFMMMLLACTSLLTFTQCGSDDPSPAKPADVYVAGNFNTLAGEGGYNWIPVYWKNGEMVELSESNGDADIIGVNNGDVYVLGDLSGDNGKIRIWKNGVMTDFTDGADYAYVYNIKFFGDDMYVVGTIDDRATYWKNGVSHTINTTLDSRAYDILIDGADVYVAGFERAESGYTIATIWKNDESTDLSDGSSYAEVSGIAMSNGDLYASGTVNQTLKMWKNGVVTPLGTAGNSGTGMKSIAIHNNDVYIVGDDNDVATLWKNGVSTPLPVPESASTSYAYAISFDGNDMFILGEGNVSSKWPVLVWKNNELFTPYDGTIESSAYSMSVARSN